MRVPLLNASLTDAVFSMTRDVTVEEINALRTGDAADGDLKGILGFEDRPLVSADYTNDTRSGIVDGPSTMVVDNRLVKVLIWYDNEYALLVPHGRPGRKGCRKHRVPTLNRNLT